MPNSPDNEDEQTNQQNNENTESTGIPPLEPAELNDEENQNENAPPELPPGLPGDIENNEDLNIPGGEAYEVPPIPQDPALPPELTEAEREDADFDRAIPEGEAYAVPPIPVEAPPPREEREEVAPRVEPVDEGIPLPPREEAPPPPPEDGRIPPPPPIVDTRGHPREAALNDWLVDNPDYKRSIANQVEGRFAQYSAYIDKLASDLTNAQRSRAANAELRANELKEEAQKIEQQLYAYMFYGRMVDEARSRAFIDSWNKLQTMINPPGPDHDFTAPIKNIANYSDYKEAVVNDPDVISTRLHEILNGAAGGVGTLSYGGVPAVVQASNDEALISSLTLTKGDRSGTFKVASVQRNINGEQTSTFHFKPDEAKNLSELEYLKWAAVEIENFRAANPKINKPIIMRGDLPEGLVKAMVDYCDHKGYEYSNKTSHPNVVPNHHTAALLAYPENAKHVFGDENKPLAVGKATETDLKSNTTPPPRP